MQKKLGLLFQTAIALILLMGSGSGMASSISMTYQGLPYDNINEFGNQIDQDPSRFMYWKIEFDESALHDNHLDQMEIDYFEMADSYNVWDSNLFDVCNNCSFNAKLKFNPGTLTVLEFSIHAILGHFGGRSDWQTGDETCSDISCVKNSSSSTPGVWAPAPVPLPAPIWLFISGLFGLSPFLRRNRATVK